MARSHIKSKFHGTNIRVRKRKTKTYYYYITPNGTEEPLVHGDERASIEAAVALNLALKPSTTCAVERILKTPKTQKRPQDLRVNPPFAEIIQGFRKIPHNVKAQRGIATRTKNLDHYEYMWGRTLVNQINTRMIAVYLGSLSQETARKEQTLLQSIFRFAQTQGYDNLRPMIDMETIKAAPTQIQRHNWEAYKTIYQASPDWLKRACDSLLYTLQRRGDVLEINLDTDVDMKAKTMRVLQNKTKHYTNPVYLEIGMGKRLYENVVASRMSGINCPYLVHYRPKRITKGKLHPFAVSDTYLTREFSKVRDEVGVYNHLPPKQRPCIHSIRALGIWLYHKAGYPDQYIMQLAGHSSAEMLQRYLRGHEDADPIKIDATLDLDNVDLTNINWTTDLSPDLLKLAEDAG